MQILNLNNVEKVYLFTVTRERLTASYIIDQKIILAESIETVNNELSEMESIREKLIEEFKDSKDYNVNEHYNFWLKSVSTNHF